MSFTAIYSDANGAANLKTLDFLASTDGNVANAIYASYDRTSEKLRLYDNAGTTPLATTCTPATAGAITNSQGTLDCLQTTVTTLGNSITIKWTVIPKVAFVSATAKQIKLRAIDNFSETTGLVQKGTWIINTKPTLGTLTPSTGTTEQGKAQTFAAIYKDADGAANLKNLEFLVSPDGTMANGIRVRYTRATNKLSIFNDAGTAILQTCTQGAAGTTIQNTRGIIDCEATTVSTSGTDITVNWSITPKAVFASATARQVKMKADDKAGATTGWVKKGDWTINTVPTLADVTPSPMTTEPAKPQAFTATYTDADGAADLKTLEFLVTNGTTANAFYLKYDRATNKLTLFNDDGATPNPTTCTPGGAGTPSNSQGTLNCASTSVSAGAKTISITFTITPKAGFASTAPKDLRLSATDAADMTTGLINKGIWTIIPTNTAPAIGTLTPVPLTSTQGTAQTLTATYTDPDGFANIKTTELMVSPAGAGPNIIWATYDRATNTVSLKNDAGTGYLATTCKAGESGSTANSQGTINCANMTVTGSGNTLTVNWNITPKNTFTGTKKVWLMMKDNSDAPAGPQNEASWTWTINP
jgi:hypothetical protein